MTNNIQTIILDTFSTLQKYNEYIGKKNVQITDKLLKTFFKEDLAVIKDIVETDGFVKKYPSFILSEKNVLEKMTKFELAVAINNGDLDSFSFKDYEKVSGVSFKKITKIPLKDFLEIIKFFNERYNKRITLTNTNMSLMLQVLENGHSVEEIKQAFVGREKDPWWKSKNLIDSFDTLFRSRTQQGTPIDYIEKFSIIGEQEGTLYKKEALLEAGRKVKEELGLQDDEKIITLANGGSWTENMFTKSTTFEHAKILIENLQTAYKNFISSKK